MNSVVSFQAELSDHHHLLLLEVARSLLEKGELVFIKTPREKLKLVQVGPGSTPYWLLVQDGPDEVRQYTAPFEWLDSWTLVKVEPGAWSICPVDA